MLDGAIRFGAVNLAGKESVVGLAEPPQWFGEVALLDGGQRTHHAWADSDATLAHVPLPAITHWLADTLPTGSTSGSWPCTSCG